MERSLKKNRYQASAKSEDDLTMIKESMANYSLSDRRVVHWVSRQKTSGAGVGTAALIDIVRTGLPINELEALQEKLDVPMERMLGLLDISKTTLHRRRKTQSPLTTGESDRVLRYARLLGRAVEVMESEDIGRKWLKSPQYGLGGAVPIDYAATEIGAREVEDLLGRIEYAVYS